MTESNLPLVLAIDAHKAALRRNASTRCEECGHQTDSWNVTRTGRAVLEEVAAQVRAEDQERVAS